MSNDVKNSNDNDDFLNSDCVYSYISKDNLTSQDFIAKYYQIIPKYYLANHVDELILHYSMGSGKTSAAINCVLDLILQQNDKTIYDFLGFNKTFPKVLIIGPGYSTKTAFKNDLSRPEYNILNYVKTANDILKKNQLYTNPENFDIDYKNTMINKVENYVNFSTYQKVFNLCFPDIQKKSYIQNIESLMTHYSKHQIEIDPSFLESIRNSTIVIDEIQRMYVNDNMNTWGFVIGCLTKKAKEYNLKFLFLTGTMINSSTSELPIIMSILNHDNFINLDEYFETINLYGISTQQLKSDKKEEIINFFKNIILFYDNSSHLYCATRIS